MAKSITVIPAKKKARKETEEKKSDKLIMAAYCRVSTDQSEQLSSYEAQVKYYTNYIKNSTEYAFGGIYADEGISGTNTKKREQFKMLMKDCSEGKIDMIITKSISRFARNTLDCLNYVRMLKDKGIGIIFEKENINTLDSKGEVLLTILSSLAQDESRSISENCTWGVRRRFEQGKVLLNHTKFMGYDKDEDGNLIINEEQAKFVRWIYRSYLDGLGAYSIVKEIERRGIKTWNGKTKWYTSTIDSMLSNEKYKGDALLQKTYTVDFLTKKRVKNNGEIPKYYVEGSHPAIVDKDIWEAVQLELERRRAFAKKYNVQKVSVDPNNPMRGKIICGECGSVMGRKIWHINDDKYRKNMWGCKRKYAVKGIKGCNSKHIDETVLHQVFIEVINQIIDRKEEFMEKWKVKACSEDPLGKYKAKQFMKIFKNKNHITDFNNELFYSIVEKVLVVDKTHMIVSFLDGTDVECNIE